MFQCRTHVDWNQLHPDGWFFFSLRGRLPFRLGDIFEQKMVASYGQGGKVQKADHRGTLP